MIVFTNFVAFQFGWFATVLGAANGMPWLGPLAVLAAVALHFRLSRRPVVEARLLAGSMLLGLVADSLLLATGWIAYPNGSWIPGFAPYWIVTLWALFATTLNVSMGWLKGRFIIAALFGAIGGPLSYLAGAKLGAITLLEPTAALLALATAWAALMPVLLLMAARLQTKTPETMPAYIQAEWRERPQASRGQKQDSLVDDHG